MAILTAEEAAKLDRELRAWRCEKYGHTYYEGLCQSCGHNFWVRQPCTKCGLLLYAPPGVEELKCGPCSVSGKPLLSISQQVREIVETWAGTLPTTPAGSYIDVLVERIMEQLGLEDE